jgi:hypothetical protein
VITGVIGNGSHRRVLTVILNLGYIVLVEKRKHYLSTISAKEGRK